MTWCGLSNDTSRACAFPKTSFSSPAWPGGRTISLQANPGFYFPMPNYASLAAAISPALARSAASFSLRFSATSLMIVDWGDGQSSAFVLERKIAPLTLFTIVLVFSPLMKNSWFILICLSCMYLT